MRRGLWSSVGLTAACAAALVVAPAAPAGSLTRSGDRLTFTAAQGETNQLLVVLESSDCGSIPPPCTLIQDVVPISSIPPECESLFALPNSAACPTTTKVTASLGDGNDQYTPSDVVSNVSGGAGNDVIQGWNGADTIYGGPGNDTIDGRDGNDTLYGEGGTDTIYGGGGNDIVDGGLGRDRLLGDAPCTAEPCTGGDDEIFAQDDWLDSVTCGAGYDIAHVDFNDVLARDPAQKCESVDRAPKPQCVVPNVRGKTLGVARAELAQWFCRVGKITRAHSRVRRGRVVSQLPRAGKHLRVGTRVRLVISLGPRRRR